jgi:hypothetical protein
MPQTIVNRYFLGTQVELVVTIARANAPADPSDPFFVVRAPDGTETTYPSGQYTHTATGSYILSINPNQVGTWWWRFEGSGIATVALERYFVIEDTVFS